MSTNLKTTMLITELSQQRGYDRGIGGEPIVSDWSYSVEIEIEIGGAGQSITHKTSLPLEEWQYRAIHEARIHAHEMFREKITEAMKSLETLINHEHIDALDGTPCPAIESGED